MNQVPRGGNGAASWRQRCHPRMEILKARVFPIGIQDPPEPFAENNCVIFELQKVVQNGSVDAFVDVLDKVSLERKLALSAIFDQVTFAGDSLLHEAVYFGKAEIVELIGHHFPGLLTKANMDGDTPLHVAARLKNSGVIIVILTQYNAHRPSSSVENNNDGDNITRLTNEYGNTALHEAVYSNDLAGAIPLFYLDEGVAHYLNKSGISPLYLAVLNSNEEIVDLLFQATFPVDKPLPRCHGISPLHAAISTKNADLLDKIAERRSDLLCLRDEHGGNPMHFAASTGYLEGVRILLKSSTQAAVQYNTKGHLPIHLAAKRGHVKVVKEFCEREWADPRGLLNKECQNILHVAAKHGQNNVVEYLLRDTQFKQLNINKKDKNGNTPLHLAAENLHHHTVLNLTFDKRIDANLKNNEGLTARDTVLLKEDIQIKLSQETIDLILKFAGSKKSDKVISMLKRREPPNADMLKNKMDTLMLVLILIVTVTFAAGFTVPGGVQSSDRPHPGTAILGHNTTFKIFCVFNMMAMYTATFGSFLLLWTQVGKISPLNGYILALFMAIVALLSMSLSFMAASYLLVGHVSWLAYFTLTVAISYSSYIIFWLSNSRWTMFLAAITFRYRVYVAAILVVSIIGTTIWRTL